MANFKSNVKSKRVQNLLVVDPSVNPVDIEDLNISVELEVFQREDEPIIYSDDNVTATNDVSLEPTRISFIDGSGNQETHLTTHYTEINTKFNDENKDLGTLGIESIDIGFNTSYVPIVKIRFKDIRARLFEMGDESPYNFMFRMPYPIFYLTVKGYYGKPVRYALHMTKFNGELDNDTGSFIITCDFIGYTYAFLADILLGFLKGVVYTEEGLNIIKGDSSFTTFEEMAVIIKELEANIIKFRNENKKLKALTVYDDLNSKLEAIKASLEQNLVNLNSNFKSLKDIDVKSSKYMSITFESNKLSKLNKETYSNTTLNLIKKYNELNKIAGNTKEYPILAEDFGLDSNGIYFKNFKSHDFLVKNSNNVVIRPKTFEEFQNSDIINKYKNFKVNDDETLNEIKEKYYNDTINIINIKDRLNPNINAYNSSGKNVLDIRFAMTKLNLISEKLTNDYNESKKQVTEEFTKSINEFLDSTGLDFDATIGSLFEILCKHVDLFIKVLKRVERKIDDDIKGGLRNLPASKKNNITEYLDVNGSTEISVKPFPEYINKEDGSYVEKWLGSDTKFEDYQEVLFINDLYESMIKSAKKDKKIIEGITTPTKGWFPVNPLETLASNNSNINPWEEASDLNIEPIIKLMLQRMTLFLGYSYKNLTLEEIKNVAEIEAHQAYNSIINVVTKKGLIANDASIEEVSNRIIQFIGDNVEEFGKLGDFHGLRFYFNNNSPFNIFSPNDGNGTLTYHHDSVDGGFTNSNDAFNDKQEYIPINQTSNSLNLKNNELNNLDVRSSYNRTFVSNIVSNIQENENILNTVEYETFIKIIDENKYNKFLNYDSYIPKDDNGLFGGNYKTPEFIINEDNSPKAYDFYDKITKKGLLNRLKKEKDFTFQPKFVSNNKNFSLFGSKFYYNQNNFGKALLFLHTLPFNGLGRDKDFKKIIDDESLKLFNERAGFISVPYSWVLFLGGLLYRQLEGGDFITYVNDNTNESLIPNLNEAPEINNDNLLINYHSVSEVNTATDNINQYIEKTHYMNFGIGNYSYDFGLIINRLPDSVKQVFINQFLDWVDTDWDYIKRNLQIFTDDVTNTEIDEYWNYLGSSITNIIELNQPYINYDNINSFDIKPNSFVGNFDITILDDSVLSNILNDFMVDNKIIINSTYRIWEGSDKRLSNFNLPSDNVKEYLKTFFETYKSINKELVDSDSQIKKSIFNTDNVDDIKLSLYKNIKSIYNKWVVGVHPEMGSVILNNLYDSFEFIDRSYTDISDKFKISPTGFMDFLTSNSNINFYNFIARILRDNNFDFIPLPTFVDFKSTSEVESIFEPVRFNQMSPTRGPQFICMYFGEQSNQLNIDKKNKKKRNDSFSIYTKYDKNGDLVISDFSELPEDFKSTNKNIPYFLVDYANQNQSMFKKITLNQSEFTETNESLEIIESISNMNRNNSIGQNLFDIYNNRAYSAEVEMLGCAQIQPFMFFQVNNVPIFDGAYTIINTRHHIKPNHMTTTFKGVRIRRVKTKMIDDETLYAHLISNLNEVDSEGADLSDLTKDRVIEDFNIEAVNSGITNNTIGIIIEE